MNSVVEHRLFRPVKGGYIFRLPKGIFHHTQYRVTKAQKAQILAVIEPERGRWMTWVTRSALALAVVSGVAVHQAAGAPLDASLFLDRGLIVSFYAFLVVHIMGTSMAYRAISRRLQPLLAGLPRFEELPFTPRRTSGAPSSQDSAMSQTQSEPVRGLSEEQLLEQIRLQEFRTFRSFRS